MDDETADILVVDDEPNIGKSCVKILSRVGHRVECALDGREALERMETRRFDVVITDLKMSRIGGMEVLRRVRERDPNVVVVVITGYAAVSSAVEVMKTGAFDYLPKPFTPEELRAVVRQAVAERKSRLENRRLQERPADRRPPIHQMVAESRRMKQVIAMVAKVAPTDATVLVYGESGTGKELVARAVHANGRRSQAVFFAVDCGTLSDTLLESELFGHRKGAFTGAHQDKKGIFEQADGGTVFLDEIGNISLEVQGKLLRFLESRELMPVGGTTPRKVDVRLIFATNQNLEEMVASGTFREDFYYRIYVYPILLPPLRERREDILPIAYHFLRIQAEQLEKEIRGFTDAAARRLAAYDWPGNVRQLRNVVERSAIVCETASIGIEDLPQLGEGEEAEVPPGIVPADNEELKLWKKKIRRQAVAEVEKNFLVHALSRNDGNITRAARSVGLQRSNFQAMMKRHGLSAHPPKKDA